MRRPTEENPMIPKLCIRGAALAAAMLAVAAPAALAAAANRITSVEVDGPRVVVHGSARPDFTVFKLADPARLVVDLASADVTQASAPRRCTRTALPACRWRSSTRARRGWAGWRWPWRE